MVGCNSSSNNFSCDESKLLKTVNEYFSYEMRMDWAKTYSYRYAEYKEGVSLNKYIKLMSKDTKGWKFISFKVLKTEVNNDWANVLILFTEKPPNNHFTKKFTTKNIITIKDESVWLCENSKWKAYNAVPRFHVTMNAPLIGLGSN